MIKRSAFVYFVGQTPVCHDAWMSVPACGREKYAFDSLEGAPFNTVFNDDDLGIYYVCSAHGCFCICYEDRPPKYSMVARAKALVKSIKRRIGL